MMMVMMMNWLRSCRLGEAFWTVMVAAEMFCVDHKFLVGAFSLSLLLSVFVWVCLRRAKASREIAEGEVSQLGVGLTEAPSGRMRKRDIVRYYGKRMIRKAGMELRHLRRRPKERVLNAAKRFLQGPDIPERQLYKEPPAAFLEADPLEGDSNIPSEVLYLLKSVRAFGHFEKPLFMELCKHVETTFVPSGAILFRPGQLDDSIYVVRNGRLKVYIMEPDGSELPLKEVGPGDSVHSMLSILDAITGNPKPFKTVTARAIRDSYVLQVNGKAFDKFFENNPDSLLRMVQIIMLRLQRVTFLALNQFLGLGRELLNQKPNVGEYHIHKLRQKPPKPSGAGVGMAGSMEDLPTANTLLQTSIQSSLVAVDSDTDTPATSKPHPPSQSQRVELIGQHQKGGEMIITGAKQSTDSDPLSDDSTTLSGSITKKTVAINTFQVEHFSSRLLPVQSPEFDNVIDQARVDRHEFSSEVIHDNTTMMSLNNSSSGGVAVSVAGKGDSLKRGIRFSHFARMESSQVLEAAILDLINIFQVKEASLLKGRVQLIEVPAESVLGLEGDLESCVYFIATGKLKVYRHTGDAGFNSQDLLYVACPGEFCGVLSALTGEPSFISIVAAVDSHLIAITKTNLYHIMSVQPRAVCGLAFDLVQRLSPIVRQIDFALDWTELEAGKALYRQGDEAHTAYIILNGRVRSVVKRSDGKKQLVDEFGRGETIGVVEVMTSSSCATTVHAIRDTELACLPAGLINTIKMKQPRVVSRLIQLLGEKILGSYTRVSFPNTTTSTTTVPDTIGTTDIRKHMVSNLSTVAVVPITSDVPLSHFTRELCAAICNIAPALRLTSGLIQEELGSAALESVHEYRLRTWLGHQEDNHRIVLYEADGNSHSPWTARCIRQADCILLLGLAEKGPQDSSMGQILKQVESISMRVQKELILLHRENVAHPTGTVKWLNALGWLSSHFHIRCPDYFFTTPLPMSEDKGLPLSLDKHSDFSRLARRLTGTSIGLVLGGGGARGLAHVGAIKAFMEAGLPIDIVGGTSIGANVGALLCEERDAEKVEKRAREFSVGMARYTDKVIDLTYPTTSMFTGKAFNNLIRKTFGEKQIEDLWLPYFCITTDITDSKMRVHTSGSLWRYVRASMSLSGYLPPLCDPVDGHLLLDGGYVNNLPADVLTSQGVEKIIAIDVGSEDNNDLTNYGDHISGWYILWNKLNPFAEKLRIPNISEIQSRLAYVSCIRQLELVKKDGMCEYIRPPIDNIGTLQFGSYNSVIAVGYQHCRTVLAGWQKSHDMCHLLVPPSEERDTKKRQQHLLEKLEGLSKHRSNSVRDLVALAAQIPRPAVSQQSDEEVDGVSSPLGYWSSPEDQVFPREGQEDAPSPDYQTKAVALSDSELMQS